MHVRALHMCCLLLLLLLLLLEALTTVDGHQQV